MEKKAFYVEISKDKAEDLENVLKNKKLTKREWLESKIDEEVGKE